jgi:hypothetical protein
VTGSRAYVAMSVLVVIVTNPKKEKWQSCQDRHFYFITI